MATLKDWTLQHLAVTVMLVQPCDSWVSDLTSDTTVRAGSETQTRPRPQAGQGHCSTID